MELLLKLNWMHIKTDNALAWTIPVAFSPMYLIRIEIASDVPLSSVGLLRTLNERFQDHLLNVN